MVESAVVAVPSAPRRRARIGRTVRSTGYFLLVIIVCAIAFFPIYWMIVTSLRPSAHSLRWPPKLYPTDFYLNSFSTLFKQQPIERWLLNSTLLALMATVICIFLSVLGAYTLSSLRWRGRGAFAIFLLM